jgi:hypothetical protein
MVRSFLKNLMNFTGWFPRKSTKLGRRDFLILTGGMFVMGKYLSPHFTASECNCNGTGKLPWDDGLDKDQFMAFLELLEAIRKEWGSRPIVVNSFYRSPEYNNEISSTGPTGPHTGRAGGFAVDVGVSGGSALDLIQVAREVNLTNVQPIQGIGIKGTGPHAKRFVHLDNLPRKALWSYS